MEEKENQEQVGSVEDVTSQDMPVLEEQNIEAADETRENVNANAVSEPKTKVKKAKSEKPQESYEGLSDDEIYTRMQTEKLVQKKKKRKLLTAVAMGVAFAFALVIIILATVPVSLNPHCIDNNFAQVRLYNGTNIHAPAATIFKETEPERFGKFKKVFDKSFAQSCLSGLFSGSLFAYDIEEEHELFDVAINRMTSANPYYIRITYEKERKVTRQSGKVYYSDRYANRDWAFSFQDAYITVNADAGFKDTQVLIPVTYPDSEEGEYVIIITVKSNTNAIKKAWDDFVSD